MTPSPKSLESACLIYNLPPPLRLLSPDPGKSKTKNGHLGCPVGRRSRPSSAGNQTGYTVPLNGSLNGVSRPPHAPDRTRDGGLRRTPGAPIVEARLSRFRGRDQDSLGGFGPARGKHALTPTLPGMKSQKGPGACSHWGTAFCLNLARVSGAVVGTTRPKRSRTTKVG